MANSAASNKEVRFMIVVNSETGEIEIGGRLKEIAAESLAIIKTIYHQISEDDKDAGEAYKHFVTLGFDGVFMSNEEIEDRCDKSIAEAEKGLQLMEELLNKLKELREGHDEEPSPDDANFKDWLRSRDN